MSRGSSSRREGFDIEISRCKVRYREVGGANCFTTYLYVSLASVSLEG